MRAVVMAAAVVMGLAGCVQSPVDVRENPDIRTLPLAGNYKAATSCVQRQVEYEGGRASSSVIWHDAQRSAEVVSRFEGSVLWLIDVAQTEAAKSRATVHVSRYSSAETLHARLAEILEPCSK